MKKKYLNQLHHIQNELCEVQLEVQGYAALFSSVYEQESLSGDDLLGPGIALGKNARTLRELCRKLDRLSIELYKLRKNS